MDFRQRTKDLFFKLRYERKFQVMVVAVLAIIVWMMFDSGSQRRVQKAPETVTKQNISNSHEAVQDLVTAINNRISQTESTLEKTEQAITALNTKIDTQERSMAEVMKQFLDRLRSIENNLSGSSGVSAMSLSPEGIPVPPDNTLEPFGNIDEVKLAPPPLPSRKKLAVIGAGDSVRMKLLAGVNAPTDGTPYPVVFSVLGDVNGPDGSSLPIGEARIVAAAQGSLSDQRALFRITQLNLRYPNGARNVIDVDGWVVGEDGVRGLEGILVDPFGKVLMGALMAGTISGFGQGMSQSQMSTNNSQLGTFNYLSGDATEFAVGLGLGQAGLSWGKFIEERAKLLVPHVKVLSGREATAVFSKTLTIEGLYESLEDEDPSLHFASLD